MRPLYIFDLDGTLANVEHRRHILQDTADPQRWNKFYAACVDDTPVVSVLNTLWLIARSLDVEVRIWSGRSEAVREQTEEWLMKYLRMPSVVNTIVMRKVNDYTPDEVLKKTWYLALSDHDRKRLVAVFDDRTKVVEMWREMGVACFQVAQGNF
jgi:phosphoserine phosphatase